MKFSLLVFGLFVINRKIQSRLLSYRESSFRFRSTDLYATYSSHFDHKKNLPWDGQVRMNLVSEGKEQETLSGYLYEHHEKVSELLEIHRNILLNLTPYLLEDDFSTLKLYSH